MLYVHVVTRLLAFMYCNQKCRVKWCVEVSHNFRVCNRVKQGGVLSPLLFNIYVDVLREHLAESGQGCHVSKMFRGCLAYADGVVLLSPTVDALENMLKICVKYSVDFRIKLNTSKSKLLVFTKNSTYINVKFQGNIISQVKSETHVVHLMSNSAHIQERRVSKACKTLIVQFSLLSVKLGFCSPKVLYSLFQNYCMSLYGCQLWDYSNESVLASVFVTRRQCVRNIFSIPYNTHCNLVHLIAKDSSVRVKLHKNYLELFNSVCKSSNTLVAMMSRIVINGSGSAACRSVTFLCSIYEISKYDISLSLLSKLKDNDEECAIQRASTIVDFLHYYDIYPEQSVREIIDYMCTF